MGGILHLLKIPFTGLFIGGSAVIFISLISNYSDNRYTIVETAFKVVLVKFVVSPYTPINAYFAVMLQTLFGFILFWRGFNKVSAIILGFFSLFFSGIQKLLVITLIFGMTLWESIDVFIDFIVSRIAPGYQNQNDLYFSIIIVSLYMLIHIGGGIAAGIYAANLPERLKRKSSSSISFTSHYNNNFHNSTAGKKRKKNWWKKPTTILILMISILLIVISFLFEEVEKGIALQIGIMLIRSFIIIIVWHYFLSPVFLKLLNRMLAKRKKKHLNELNKIIDVFPSIKSLIKYSWSLADSKRGLLKPLFLIDNILITYLLFEPESDGT